MLNVIMTSSKLTKSLFGKPNEKCIAPFHLPAPEPPTWRVCSGLMIPYDNIHKLARTNEAFWLHLPTSINFATRLSLKTKYLQRFLSYLENKFCSQTSFAFIPLVTPPLPYIYSFLIIHCTVIYFSVHHWHSDSFMLNNDILSV